MKRRTRSIGLGKPTVFLAVAVGLLGCSQQADEGGQSTVEAVEAENPIAGSYRLTARDLPDGTRLEPPDIFGFMTYIDDVRHFHLSGVGPDGEPFSVSFVANYELTDGSYSETTMLEVTHNSPPGSGVVYNPGPNSFSVSLTQNNGPSSVAFRDSESGPLLTFTSEGMTAEQSGEFVDHWIRVR